jgi:hypothetical protein
MAARNFIRSFTTLNRLNNNTTPLLSFCFSSPSPLFKLAPHAKQPQRFCSSSTNFKQVCEELRKITDKEIEEIAVRSEEEKEFLETKNFTFEVLDGVKRQASRSVKGFTVNVIFEVPESLDIKEDIPEQNPDEPEAVSPEADQAQAEVPSYIKLKVTVKSEDHTSDLQAQCVIGQDRRFYVETIQTSDGPNPVWIYDLSEEFQQRLYDFFDHLGLDDQFANFAILHSENHFAQNAINHLKNLSKFLK